ncbi:hypothetical protein [Streptomyces flaveolus]|uniref:hypothetical protein n=1 Tax=Streptomyces flaveolus TaxID=67297 RepID=UPI003816A065
MNDKLCAAPHHVWGDGNRARRPNSRARGGGDTGQHQILLGLVDAAAVARAEAAPRAVRDL